MASTNIAMKTLNKTIEEVWTTLRAEMEETARSEPVLAALSEQHILGHGNLCSALSLILAEKLDRDAPDAEKLRPVFAEVLARHPRLEEACCLDLLSIPKFDPAAKNLVTSFLFFKGFHALQASRIANALWQEGRQALALFLQSRVSEVFDVDIHPAAKIGHGITLDHASGVVIGETAVVGNNILMLHGVTLGTRGFSHGDRHPVIEDDVVIGAGAKILGRITVGKGARVAAGSLVLDNVPADHTVAGVPARVVKSPDPPATI